MFLRSKHTECTVSKGTALLCDFLFIYELNCDTEEEVTILISRNILSGTFVIYKSRYKRI